ncbi:Hypothetical protein GSB_153095, partial [Giardia duodenalis]
VLYQLAGHRLVLYPLISPVLLKRVPRAQLTSTLSTWRMAPKRACMRAATAASPVARCGTTTAAALETVSRRPTRQAMHATAAPARRGMRNYKRASQKRASLIQNSSVHMHRSTCAAPSSASLHCVVGRDTTWQCDCPRGDYTTYNKTCILKAKNADPTTKLARGPCGGPGAGYINDNGSCTCNAGFRRVGDLCYSYDCLPVGVTADTKGLDLNPHVCSGKGICAYNQLTGRYGCECNDGYEAFGGYCTHSGCAGKVIHNGEVKYVECKVYDGTIGSCVQNTEKTGYICKCSFPYNSFNGICVHRGCISNGKYCGGDVLASCAKGSDSRYGCVCSEGYELSDERNEYGNKAKCVPSKCMYKRSMNDTAEECNGLGTCGSESSLLKDKTCTCTGEAKLYALRDANGELKNTCILDKCISSNDGVKPPVICGGLGRCGPSGCICDLGTKLFGKVCVGINCFINTTDDSGKITESICGGETVGVCTKVESFGDRRDYACKCKEPAPEGYEEVDGFCLPKSCIFAITASDNTQKNTMCGGKHLGTCVLNATQTVTPYCKCINRYDIVKVTTGKCMKRDCLSDSLPGGPTGYVECSGHGTCRGDHNAGYSCGCAENYQTVQDDHHSYLCIPQACIISSTDTTTICSGRGTCQFKTEPGSCQCQIEYTGEKCQSCATNYKEYTDKRCYLNNCPTDSCSADGSTDAGTCRFGGNSFSCACINSSFVVDSNSKKCRKSRCVWTDPYDSLEKTCYGMGTCNDNGESTGQCSCSSNTILVGTNICAYRECLSGEDNAQKICKERGVCIESIVAGKGMCRCDSNVYRTDKATGQCFVKECFGAADSILSEVCDGGGTCDESAKRCNCDSNNGFQNLPNQNGCVHTNCISSDKKLCSGFGACEKTDGSYRCLCTNHYTLVEKDCVPTNCLNSTVTCNGGGACTGTGTSATCSCKQGWALRGTLCYPAACISNGLICGGNGDCPLSDGGSCSCRSGYESTSEGLCISSRCVQRGADGTVQVCGGNGRCVSESGVEPSCVCNEGFSLTGDFICGVPASSNKSSAGTTIAIVVVVLLVLAAVAGFLVWWFVIRPRKAGVLRERAPRKDASLTRSRSLKKQAASNASLHADAPLLSQLSNANSSIQL